MCRQPERRASQLLAGLNALLGFGQNDTGDTRLHPLSTLQVSTPAFTQVSDHAG